MELRWPQVGLLLLAVAGLAGRGEAQESSLDEVHRDPAGRLQAILRWEQREIIGIGRARRVPGVPRANLERAAVANAYANLAAAGRRARIDPGRVVDDLVAAEQAFSRYFVAYLRGANVGALHEESGGFVAIDASLPLFGPGAPGGVDRQLGTELYQRDDVWATEVTRAPGDLGEYTGVLFDARDLAATGAFAPLVKDTTGRVVWHVECADRELAEREGAVEFLARDELPDEGTRAGARPLVIPVVELGEGGVLIVSEADGARLAPRREAARPGLRWALWDAIKVLTPVSPFQRSSVVTGKRRLVAASPRGEV